MWGEGSTWEELEASIDACPAALKEPWLREGIKFRVCVESFGCKMGESEQINHIHRLSFIPFKGVVSLKQPEVMA